MKLNKELIIILHRKPFPIKSGAEIRFASVIKIAKKNYTKCSIVYPSKYNESYLDDKGINYIGFKYDNSLKMFFNFIVFLFKGFPIQTGFFFNSKISRFLKKQRGKQLLGITFRAVPYLQHEKNFLIDFVDCYSLNYRNESVNGNILKRCIYKLENIKIAKVEKFLVQNCKKGYIINNRDKEELSKLIPLAESKISVLPNLFLKKKVALKSAISLNLLFVGDLDYLPNRFGLEKFLIHIFPKIKETFPTIMLHIVGSGKRIYWLKHLINNNIKYHGYIKDLNSVYQLADIIINPIISGSGTQNKLIEGIAYGKLILSSSYGAQCLIGYNVPKLVDVCDSSDHYIKAISKYLKLSKNDLSKHESECSAFIHDNHSLNSLSL